jgi:5-methylcytosine-specific restriction protein A
VPGDPFYQSAAWRALRDAALVRSERRCEVPGCGSSKGLIVDHVVSRRRGGADAMENLRVLCRAHDNQVKEGRRGARANGGALVVRGCANDGRPVDPRHPWNKSGRGVAPLSTDGRG